MAQVKVTELAGAALDWAVAKLSGHMTAPFTEAAIRYGNVHLRYDGCTMPHPFDVNKNWNLAGPIIDSEEINMAKVGRSLKDAIAPHPECYVAHIDGSYAQYGETRLIAAMRSYVASKLGDTVEIPDELVKIM